MTVDIAIVPLVGHWPLGVPWSGEVPSFNTMGSSCRAERRGSCYAMKRTSRSPSGRSRSHRRLT